MKSVDTSNIIAGTRRLGASKQTIDHLQEAFKEVATSVIKQFTSDTTNYFKLHGLVDSDGSPTGYDISAGAVYFNGEVYQVDAFVGSHATNVPVLNFETSYRAGDPVKYSDNNTFNTHEIKKMVITLAVSGSGVINLSSLQVLGQNWVTTSRINDQAVTNAKIADGTIQGPKIQDYTITPTKVIQIATLKSSVDTEDMDLTTTLNTIGYYKGAANAPNANGFLSIHTDNYAGFGIQIAIQLDGSGAGTIYTRKTNNAPPAFPITWASWTSINT